MKCTDIYVTQTFRTNFQNNQKAQNKQSASHRSLERAQKRQPIAVLLYPFSLFVQDGKKGKKHIISSRYSQS